MFNVGCPCLRWRMVEHGRFLRRPPRRKAVATIGLSSHLTPAQHNRHFLLQRNEPVRSKCTAPSCSIDWCHVWMHAPDVLVGVRTYYRRTHRIDACFPTQLRPAPMIAAYVRICRSIIVVADRCSLACVWFEGDWTCCYSVEIWNLCKTTNCYVYNLNKLWCA
jgi:hypothetical protein